MSDSNEKSTDKVVVDGDRIIEFINAFKAMASIIDQVNVMAVKDCFLIGKKLGCIESVIEKKQEWLEAFNMIAQAERERLSQLEQSLVKSRMVIQELKHLRETVRDFDRVTQKIVELCDSLERLEKHRANGNLELLMRLEKKQQIP